MQHKNGILVFDHLYFSVVFIESFLNLVYHTNEFFKT